MTINQKIFKDSLLITIITFIGLVFSFYSTMLFAKLFGANQITDAYYIALIIPFTFINVIGGVIKIIFVPIFVEEKKNNPQKLSEFIGSSISLMLLISLIGILILLSFVFFGNINPVADLNARKITNQIMLEFIPYIPLVLLFNLFNAVYNSYQKFALAETTNLIKIGITVIFMFIFSKKFGIHSVVLGTIIGQFISLILFQRLIKNRLGLNLKPSFSFNKFAHIFKISIWPFLTYLVLQAEPLMARIFAAFLPDGSITLYTYADKIAVIPGLIIGSGYLSVLVSHWSKTESEGKEKELQNSIMTSLKALITLLAPIITGLFLLRYHITSLLFQNEKLNTLHINAIVDIFSFLIIGVLPIYLTRTMNRILIVKKEFSTFFYICLLGALIFPFLAFIFAKIFCMKVKGIALASICSNTLVLITSVLVLRDKYIKFDFSSLILSNLRIFFGCLFMSFIIIVFFKIQTLISIDSKLIVIMIITFIGIISYSIILHFMKHPEFINIEKYILEKIQNIFSKKVR